LQKWNWNFYRMKNYAWEPFGWSMALAGLSYSTVAVKVAVYSC
jgi:hypothetical protein